MLQWATCKVADQEDQGIKTDLTHQTICLVTSFLLL